MGSYYRKEKIDLARGIAILAMIFYHFCWDLGEFGIIDREAVNSGGWRLFAQIIGSSFLFISGLSFWFFFRFGRNLNSFWNRFLKLFLGSLFVSIGTYLAYGDYFIFFGILHLFCICNLVAFAIVRFSVTTLIGFAIFTSIFASYVSFDTLGSRFFAWSGLYSGSVGTVDFYPFFPWASAYILGLAFGKLVYKNRTKLDEDKDPIEAKSEQFFITRIPKAVLKFLSSYSLYIYLIHQPILFGLIIFSMSLL